MANVMSCQVILTDSILSAELKEIYNIVKFSKWEGEKKSQIIYKGKCLGKKKKILNSHPIKILSQRRSLSNHHQVTLISMNSSQMLAYKNEENKMQLQHSCVGLTYMSPNRSLLTMLYLVSDVFIMKTTAVIWKMLFPP